MKQLLPLIIVLLAAPASAVDYVKCEAMQNANSRLLAIAEQEEKAVWKEVLSKYEIQSCGQSPDPLKPGYSTQRMFAYFDCTSAAYGRNYDAMKKELGSDPRIAEPRARAARVQADYKKAGCL